MLWKDADPDCDPEQGGHLAGVAHMEHFHKNGQITVKTHLIPGSGKNGTIQIVNCKKRTFN